MRGVGGGEVDASEKNYEKKKKKKKKKRQDPVKQERKLSTCRIRLAKI